MQKLFDELLKYNNYRVKIYISKFVGEPYKDLVILVHNIYINKNYAKFNQDIRSEVTKDIIYPNYENDIQTKLAEIAMKNMIEDMDNFKTDEYFSDNGLYIKFLKDACSEASYPFKNYDLIKYDNCGTEYCKHIVIKKVNPFLRQ